MERIGQAIDTVPSGTAIDILFHREPTIAEVDAIIAHLEVLASDQEPSVNEFGDIALLAKNMTLPSDLTLADHGDPHTPRLGLARFQGELPKEAHKRLSVRYPFADDRAETFLSNEAKQLPNTAPGVIMLATTDAPGEFREWSAILGRRLQPNMHTRVSAICLFEAGFELTVDGEAWLPRTQLLIIAHGRNPLPSWLDTYVRRYESPPPS